MGKTNQPLTIAVWGPYLQRDDIQDLIVKGHTIVEATELVNLAAVDLIIHPRAHRWDDAYDDTTYLEAALKQARRAKKEAKT